MAIDLRANIPPRSYRDIRVTKAASVLAAGIDVERVAAGVTDDILADVWPAVEDPAFLDALGSSVHDDLRATFDVLSGRVDLAVVPQAALEFADAAAHLSIPAAEIHGAYRVYAVSLCGAGARSLGRQRATQRCSTS